KPIGTSLADWGRKDPSRLAFEQVAEYVTHYSWPEKKGTEAGAEDKSAKNSAAADHMPYGTTERPAHGVPDPDNMEYAIDELGPTQGWLMEKLLGHEREGFLWEKLHQPRSYDFKKTENKGYNDRLRMPQFPFKEDEIDAVMTFVLGLVSEPPA